MTHPVRHVSESFCIPHPSLMRARLFRAYLECFISEAYVSLMLSSWEDNGARDPRLPLFVQVVTQPPIHDCWSVNISNGGIGLVAGRHQDDIPEEGDEIDLEFSLPDSGSTVRARAEVVWVHHSFNHLPAVARVAIGLRFSWVPGGDRAELKRYLLDYRFHVGVAFALGSEKRLMEEALGRHTRLHFADTVAELRDLLARGDVAVIVACGSDGKLLRTVADQIRGPEECEADESDHREDLAPRLVHYGRTAAEDLVSLFNQRRMHRALEPPQSSGEIRDAVLSLCGDYGLRTEQRRSTQALERALLRERARTRPEAQLDRLVAERMVHRSREIDHVLHLARRVAPHKVGVLLQGETGTGKEVLARIIHDLSERANASFVIQDCGSLPDNLLESELFGHVRGAFTGATSDHPGLFVLADGGTIFLDEIENTTPSLQAKLLRGIETGAVRPVGGTRVQRVDVRVIAASNRDLAKEVEAGRFRADLFYRLNTFVIDIPPLRRRRADIAPLADHFLSLANGSLVRAATGFTESARAALESYAWPGNVRELKNVVERAVLLGEPGRHLTPELLPETIARPGSSPSPGRPSLKEAAQRAERELIVEALERHGGVLRRAARDLDVSAVTLGRRVRELGLR